MAQSEFYESTIIEVEATFGFDSFSCSPDEITRNFGIEPDDVRVKGDTRTVAGGRRTITVPFSSWSIASRCDSKDVNEHLRELLSRLVPARRPIHPSWGEPSFGVLWKGNYLYAGSGPFYEPDVIAGICAWEASLYQDIYQIDQEDRDPVFDENGVRSISNKEITG